MKQRAREDQLVIGYLLGMSSEVERSQIETRYFRDQRFYEFVIAMEEELICDYISGGLTAAERQQFERHFLRTPRQRKKYDNTRRLMAFIADQDYPAARPATTPAQTTKARVPWFSLAWLNSLLAPQLNLGWSLLVTCTLVLSSLWLTTQVTVLREQVQQTETALVAVKTKERRLLGRAEKQRNEASAKHNEVRSLSALAGSFDQLQASLDPFPAEPGASVTTSNKAESASEKLDSSTKNFTLTVPSMRINNQNYTIKVPANAKTARLAIDLGAESSQFASFQAQLIDPQGRVVFTVRNLKRQPSGRLSVELPLQQLNLENYRLELTGFTATNETKPMGEVLVHLVP